MEIRRNGGTPSRKGDPENFMRIDSSFQAERPARVNGAIVTFEPGARTNWYSHPLGQTLICNVRRWLDAVRGRPDQ